MFLCGHKAIAKATGLISFTFKKKGILGQNGYTKSYFGQFKSCSTLSVKNISKFVSINRSVYK